MKIKIRYENEYKCQHQNVHCAFISQHLYDVTTLLTEGENLWQTTVGDGWWRWNNNYGYRLALWGQMMLTYSDGRCQKKEKTSRKL